MVALSPLQFDDLIEPEEETSNAPLAARMRPTTLDEIVGQDDIIGPYKPLRISIEQGKLSSMIFWGPPGSGKTTLAEVIARQTQAYFSRVPAVSSGVAEIRKVISEAKLRKRESKQTILFIDEIHRFNKAQQDAILPYVEDGTVIFIGATTENPSFEVNSALLSRTRLFVLHALKDSDIEKIIQRTLRNQDKGLGMYDISISNDLINKIAGFVNGDARMALNILEFVLNSTKKTEEDSKIIIQEKIVAEALQSKSLLYDKHGDYHYDLISALHKSLRGSDPDASLYWLARMLEAGEDPLYIIRRLIRFASEDVGMADPAALLVCVAAQQAIHFIGMPEAKLALIQAVVHLATAPKSNALYIAYGKVEEDVKKTRNEPVPLHLRNSPTKMLKNLGYSKGYKYSHEYYASLSADDPNRPPSEKLQEYLPENIKNSEYYHPTKQGKEANIFTWLLKRRRKK